MPPVSRAHRTDRRAARGNWTVSVKPSRSISSSSDEDTTDLRTAGRSQVYYSPTLPRPSTPKPGLADQMPLPTGPIPFGPFDQEPTVENPINALPHLQPADYALPQSNLFNLQPFPDQVAPPQITPRRSRLQFQAHALERHPRAHAYAHDPNARTPDSLLAYAAANNEDIAKAEAYRIRQLNAPRGVLRQRERERERQRQRPYPERASDRMPAGAFFGMTREQVRMLGVPAGGFPEGHGHDIVALIEALPVEQRGRARQNIKREICSRTNRKTEERRKKEKMDDLMRELENSMKGAGDDKEKMEEEDEGEDAAAMDTADAYSC